MCTLHIIILKYKLVLNLEAVDTEDTGGVQAAVPAAVGGLAHLEHLSNT